MQLYDAALGGFFFRKLDFARGFKIFIFLESIKPLLIVIQIVVIGNKLFSSSWIVIFRGILSGPVRAEQCDRRDPKSF